MGHKHSTLHSELRNQYEGPNCDLVMSPAMVDGAGTSGTANAHTPYLEGKNGPFKRKLSVRNISIRRSFHIGSSKRKNNSFRPLQDTSNLPAQQRIGTSATTDNLPSSSGLANGHALTAGPSGHHYHHVVHHHHTPPALPRNNGATKHRQGKDKFVMDRLRKSFRNSFRKKRDLVTESQKPHQWQSDEHAVRAGTCVFPVKYLGCVEVYESRGMATCEDALRRLRNLRRRPVKGQLYVTGDGIRVVDDDTKGLIVDQTIEKVSFCAPDRGHERGFSYICRDGTTRRWMCHGFHATKDSGERLSHAVGYAFNICLERKQKRDKESVSQVMDANNFTRTGSFRQSSITERLQDPQVAKPSEPVPVKQPVHNPFAVARPHATASLLQRQGSLRGGPLNHASPFKRQLSLRLNVDAMTEALKSLETDDRSPASGTGEAQSDPVASVRTRALSLDLAALDELASSSDTKSKSISATGSKAMLAAPPVEPIPETSSISADKPPAAAMITAMCQQLSQGLSMLSAKTDDWTSTTGAGHFSPPASLTTTTAAEATSTNNLVKDSNSLFSFSNIDKWIGTTIHLDKSNKTSAATIGIAQQLNTGSLDSGIASNSSVSGKVTTVAATAAPPPLPAVIDQMPQIPAPPPPSEPAPAAIIPEAGVEATSNHPHSHNPFLEIGPLAQPSQPQQQPKLTRRSTNPFLELMGNQGDSSTEPTSSLTEAVSPGPQSMVKAFEVSM